MSRRKKRMFDTEGLVEQMFDWIPEGPVEVQLALRGVIQSIELRDIPVSRLVAPGRVTRIPLVRPISEKLRERIGKPYLPVHLYEIHLARTEDPAWRVRTVARKFGEAILLLAGFPEVEWLQRKSQKETLSPRSRKRARQKMREILQTFAKRWLEQEQGSNREELARLLQPLAKGTAQKIPLV